MEEAAGRKKPQSSPHERGWTLETKSSRKLLKKIIERVGRSFKLRDLRLVPNSATSTTHDPVLQSAVSFKMATRNSRQAGKLVQFKSRIPRGHASASLTRNLLATPEILVQRAITTPSILRIHLWDGARTTVLVSLHAHRNGLVEISRVAPPDRVISLVLSGPHTRTSPALGLVLAINDIAGG